MAGPSGARFELRPAPSLCRRHRRRLPGLQAAGHLQSTASDHMLVAALQVFPGTPTPIPLQSAAQAQPDALLITPRSLVGPPMREPTRGKAAPALRLMPNNYGPNTRAKIRVKNVCNAPVEVAIMFWCVGCMRQGLLCSR